MLGDRISKKSVRARACKCPKGTKKVFVGDGGLRCQRKSTGRFVKTPKSCNDKPAARRTARKRRGGHCKFGVSKTTGLCLTAPRRKKKKSKPQRGHRPTRRQPPTGRPGANACRDSSGRFVSCDELTSHERTMLAARRSPGRFAGLDGSYTCTVTRHGGRKSNMTIKADSTAGAYVKLARKIGPAVRKGGRDVAAVCKPKR